MFEIVVVRHAGKKYDVEVDTSEPGIVFKNQLYSLTNVAPERQKILMKVCVFPLLILDGFAEFFCTGTFYFATQTL